MNCSCRHWLLKGVVCASAILIAIEANAAEPSSAANKDKKPTETAASGREIFLREWLPNDPRSHGGDGLGPVFNETSCVSCHNQGGVGGGGAEAKNVVVITAVRTNFSRMPTAGVAPTRPRPAAPGAPGGPAIQVTPPQIASPASPKSDLNPEQQDRTKLLNELRSLHPGLVTSRSVVLHKSGTDANYAGWRDQVLGFDAATLTTRFAAPQSGPPQPPAVTPPPAGGGFFADLVAQAQQDRILELQPPAELLVQKGRSLVSQILGIRRAQPFPGLGKPDQQLAVIPTQRNSISLFGAGLIDAIPDSAIEAGAGSHEQFPEVTGRVARLKDGRIGRFGWKAQKANLHDFTMTACAVELGLNVPDHPQAGDPGRPDYVPAGFDLNRDECHQLIQFLKDLPSPTRTESASPAITKEIQLGEIAFAKIGCAACHTADLGQARGIYSDLLVHDMGPETGDSGSYSAFQPESSGSDAEDPLSGLLTQADQGPISPVPGRLSSDVVQTGEERLPEKMIGAGRQEWRTPPLWGVRDSAPYLHDGRASSLEDAIALHGGEAQLSANRFFRLPPEERSRLLAFLRSMVAPAN